MKRMSTFLDSNLSRANRTLNRNEVSDRPDAEFSVLML